VAGGELRRHAPVIYQEGPNGRERISGGCVVEGDEVGFSIGSYDPSRPLVVDPAIVFTFGAGGAGLVPPAGDWDGL
jgi:hypothetical protein